MCGIVSAVAERNVAGFSLVSDSDLASMTLAGAEIGVALTKGFTTLITSFLTVTLALGKFAGMSSEKASSKTTAVTSLPSKIEDALRTVVQPWNLAKSVTVE